MVEIPERTSSKRALEKDRENVMEHVKRLRRDLKPKASYSSDYWMQASEISKNLTKHTELQKKISVQNFIETKGGDEAEWEKTPEAQLLFQQLHSHQADQKICERQKLRQESGDPKRSLKQSFIQLFTTSKIGLGISSSGQGRKDPVEQTNFRNALIEAYNSRNPNPSEPWLWDPILKHFVSEQNAQASHLFAYAHGQATMDAIFGPTNPPELFSPFNGLILCQEIEALFDRGLFAIVPRVPDNASEEDILTWNASDPKEYKIRILNFKHQDIDCVIHPLVSGENLTWRSLDGANVEFRNNFRPRARYLYFHFCLQILRLTWGYQQKHAETLKKEIGRIYWGTPGRYLPRNMLQAFVDELGHEYEALLQGAIEDGADAETDVQDREILLAAASDQIKAPARGDDEDEDEDEDEEDEAEE